MSRSNGDLINSRFGGGVLGSAASGPLRNGGSVSVVNLPATVNSPSSSAEELYNGYGGESAGSVPTVFPRFGGIGPVASAHNRYNFLYPERPRFFPQATTQSSNSNARSGAGGGQLQQLLSQERLFQNRSRSVENLFDHQQAAAAHTAGLRHYAATSDISLQTPPRTTAAYYGDPMAATAPLRSASSAVAVGNVTTATGNGVSGRGPYYQQQRMKATQSEQFLTKIGKQEKVCWVDELFPLVFCTGIAYSAYLSALPGTSYSPVKLIVHYRLHCQHFEPELQRSGLLLDLCLLFDGSISVVRTSPGR
jgi:hypothetical protein